MYHKILLGTDGSVDSRRATAAAAVLAQAFAAPITVAAAAVERDTPLTPWSDGPVMHPIEPERAELWARQEATWLSEQGIEAEPIVLSGSAAEALAKEALNGFDLIVVGHRGRNAGAAPRLGSVASQLTDLTPCPILIVP